MHVTERPRNRFRVAGTLFEIDSKYELIKPIGQGAYGVVISALNKETNQKVAIKKIARAFEDLVDAKRILREIKLLRKFHHDNIIGVIDIITPPSSEEFDDVYIVSDLMETDLHRIINSHQDLSLEHSQYFLYQILRALKYMHSSNVLHRDLKPSNLLLNSNCDLKVCDLGLARDIYSGCGDLTEYVVTRWYRAPEIMLACQEYSKAVDIWSVGCIFAELLLRRPFFPGDNYIDQLTIICQKLGKPTKEEMDFVTTEKARRFIANLPDHPRQSLRDHFPPHISEEALDLLGKMLEFHPGRRISVEDAIRHPFMRDLHVEDDEPTAGFTFSFGFEDQELSRNRLQSMMWEEMRGYHPERGPWKGGPGARKKGAHDGNSPAQRKRPYSHLGAELKSSPGKAIPTPATRVATSATGAPQHASSSTFTRDTISKTIAHELGHPLGAPPPPPPIPGVAAPRASTTTATFSAGTMIPLFHAPGGEGSHSPESSTVSRGVSSALGGASKAMTTTDARVTKAWEASRRISPHSHHLAQICPRAVMEGDGVWPTSPTFGGVGATRPFPAVGRGGGSLCGGVTWPPPAGGVPGRATGGEGEGRHSGGGEAPLPGSYKREVQEEEVVAAKGAKASTPAIVWVRGIADSSEVSPSNKKRRAETAATVAGSSEGAVCEGTGMDGRADRVSRAGKVAGTGATCSGGNNSNASGDLGGEGQLGGAKRLKTSTSQTVKGEADGNNSSGRCPELPSQPLQVPPVALGLPVATNLSESVGVSSSGGSSSQEATNEEEPLGGTAAGFLTRAGYLLEEAQYVSPPNMFAKRKRRSGGGQAAVGRHVPQHL